MNQYFFHPASGRGSADYDWLKTNYSFSFSNYYNPEMMGFGTLRVINDDWIAPDNGFGKHAHSDMEIITFVFSGELSHEDSLGNRASIRAGEVQAMSAGTGVFHSESNASKTEAVTLFQIWIQNRSDGIIPQYNQMFFDASERENQWQLQVSPRKEDIKVYINQDAFVSRVTLETGKNINYKKYRTENDIYVILLSGEVLVGDYMLGAKDALGIQGNTEIILEANRDSDILLLEIPRA